MIGTLRGISAGPTTYDLKSLATSFVIERMICDWSKHLFSVIICHVSIFAGLEFTTPELEPVSCVRHKRVGGFLLHVSSDERQKSCINHGTTPQALNIIGGMSKVRPYYGTEYSTTSRP